MQTRCIISCLRFKDLKCQISRNFLETFWFYIFHHVYLGWRNVILSYARIYWIPNFSDIFILFANFYVMCVCEKMYIFNHFSRLRSQNVIRRFSIIKRQNNIVLMKKTRLNITQLHEYFVYYFWHQLISVSMLSAFFVTFFINNIITISFPILI